MLRELAAVLVFLGLMTLVAFAPGCGVNCKEEPTHPDCRTKHPGEPEPPPVIVPDPGDDEDDEDDDDDYDDD